MSAGADAPAPPVWQVAQADGFSLAQEAVKQQRYAEAERHLRRYLALEPDDEDARFLLARVVAWQGRYGEAIAEYDQLLKASPENADYWLGKGQTLLWVPDNAAASACFERALRLAPRDPEAWRLAVTALVRQGPAKRERALALQAQAQTRFPKLNWNMVPQPEAGPSPAPGPLEVELSGGFDALTKGYAPWYTGQASGRYLLAPRTTVYGHVLETSRFGMWDTEVMAGGTLALGQAVTGILEGSLSPTANVLARYRGTAMAEAALGGGWVAWLRGRYAAYATAQVATGTLGTETYVGPFRLTWGASLSNSPTGGLPGSLQAAVSYMPSDRDAYALRLGAGQEVETVGPGRVVTSDVLSAGLEARAWLTPHWALTAELGWARQGVFYDRVHAQLGVRRAL